MKSRPSQYAVEISPLDSQSATRFARSPPSTWAPLCRYVRRRPERGKGYDGLYGIVQSGLRRDVLGGELFLFLNRRRDACKVLVWDGTGLCIFQKQLERGRFAKLRASWRCSSRAARWWAARAVAGADRAEDSCFGRRSVINRSEGVDIKREKDVEQLRLLALAQDVRHLTDALARKCKELEALKGDPSELQRTLARVAAATREAQATVAAMAEPSKPSEKKSARDRASTGPTPQPRLPVRCGGELRPMDD